MPSKPTLVAGLDEAGRGAAIGPMVVAAVFLRERDIDGLLQLGVCDSKKFGSGESARQKRSAVAEEIRAAAVSVLVREAPSDQIDRWVLHKGLNRLERIMALDIFQEGPPVHRALADGKKVFAPLALDLPFLSALDKADETEPVVAAASIVAKDRRDRLFARIARKYEPRFGPIAGSGYANPATERFLRAYHGINGKLPQETRLQWQWHVIQELRGIQASLPFG